MPYDPAKIYLEDLALGHETVTASDVATNVRKNEINILKLPFLEGDNRTLKDILDTTYPNIETVGSSTNLTNISNVAGKITEISDVWGIRTDITTLVGEYKEKVENVSTNIGLITTVADISEKIIAIEGVKDTSLNTIYLDLNGNNTIGSVAGIVDQIRLVAPSIQSISTLASYNLSNIDSLLEAKTAITNLNTSLYKLEGLYGKMSQSKALYDNLNEIGALGETESIAAVRGLYNLIPIIKFIFGNHDLYQKLYDQRDTVLEAANQVGTISELADEIRIIAPVVEHIEALASHEGAIGILAPQVDHIVALSPQAANIGLLAPQADNIGLLTPFSTDIQTLSPQAANIGLLAPQADNIGLLTPFRTNIQTLSPQVANIGILSAQATNIGLLTPFREDIRTAVTDLTSENSKISSVVDNMEDINDAAEHAQAAIDAQDRAEAARDKAKDWSIKSNEPVEDGLYGAKWYARRAKEWSNKENDPVTGGLYSSKHYADQAAQTLEEVKNYLDQPSSELDHTSNLNEVEFVLPANIVGGNEYGITINNLPDDLIYHLETSDGVILTHTEFHPTEASITFRYQAPDVEEQVQRIFYILARDPEGNDLHKTKRFTIEPRCPMSSNELLLPVSDTDSGTEGLQLDAEDEVVRGFAIV